VFNVYSEVDAGRIAVFNTLSQNVSVFPSAFRDGSDCLGDEEATEAVRLGFVVHEETDEIRREHLLRDTIDRQISKTLDIVIAPTLGCNFSCRYCLNGIGYSSTLDEDTIEKATAFVARRQENFEHLLITWHGGEPALFVDRIVAANRSFKANCDRNGKTFESHILTNGVALTGPATTELVESGIREFQVSVDWPADTSDRKLSFLSGQETLERVLENVSRIPDEVRILLRVNMLPGAFERSDELIDVLDRHLTRQVQIYTHHIVAPNVVDTDIGALDFLEQDVETFRELQYELKQKLRRAGYHQPYFPQDYQSGSCIARSESGYLFAPGKEIRKCFGETSGEGAFVDEAGKPNRLADAYLTAQDALHPLCRSCAYRPMCRGGCPKQAVAEPAAVEKRCTSWKFTLEKELGLYLQSLSKESQRMERLDESDFPESGVPDGSAGRD